VAEQIMKSFTVSEFDRVELIYNQFKMLQCKTLPMKYFCLLRQLLRKGNGTPVDYIYEPAKRISSGI